jgi:pyruvate dehydrogenase E2 component (dihydrolipoamide acetyltransferase)
MMEIVVPELGENIEEAEVVRILVGEGDEVAADQAILELESDKAAFEMPSPEGGTVHKVLVRRGDRVKPGQPVLEIGVAEGEQEQDEGEEGEGGEARAEAKKKVNGKAKGKAKEKGEAEEAPPEEEKAEEEDAESEEKAEKKEDEAQEGARDPERARERDGARAGGGAALPPPREDRDGEHPFPASPATRRFAREVGVELGEVAPHVRGDRITRGDIKAYLRASRRESRAPRREPLGSVRRAAARRLAEAWREIPHVTQHDRAEVGELEAARRRIREREPELPLTITALAVKAAAAALRASPRANAVLDLEAGDLVVHRAVHIGVAVDTERGLLVPVLRDADTQTTRQIAIDIAALAERARAGDLEAAEMRGATFTITNLGGIGGTSFTPIVNPPNVAILGLSRLESQLVRGPDGDIVDRLILPLSLSYDHRAIDGAEAARLTRRIAELLGSSLELLLDC